MDDVFQEVDDFKPAVVPEIEVTDADLENDATIRHIQRIRLKAILNDQQGMSSEFIKLMADTAKTAVDLKKQIADTDNSNEDRKIAQAIVDALSSKKPSDFRQAGAGNARNFDDDALPEVETFEGMLDTELHNLTHKPAGIVVEEN